MPKTVNWESGSEFHWVEGETTDNEFIKCPYRLYGSGRDALISLLIYGIKHNNWKRIIVPYYYCSEVIYAITQLNIKILFYNDSPIINDLLEIDKIEFIENDILLRVNYFALRRFRSNMRLQSKKIIVIEDHTHDPWSTWAKNSDADWCFASLRKVLPVPDGGILWSRDNNYLPSVATTTSHNISTDKKLLAMFLKKQYLEGNYSNKKLYLQMYHDGEKGIFNGIVSGISLITEEICKKYPIMEWRQKKLNNYKYLHLNLSDVNKFQVLNPEENGIIPFSFIIFFESKEKRNYFNNCLISENIFPAILWPTNIDSNKYKRPNNMIFEDLMISIHCDFRYNIKDMNIMIQKIKKIGNNC